VTSELALILIL